MTVHGPTRTDVIPVPAGEGQRCSGTRQISPAYSRIVRSDENQPMRAVLRIAFCHQDGVANSPSIVRWTARRSRSRRSAGNGRRCAGRRRSAGSGRGRRARTRPARSARGPRASSGEAAMQARASWPSLRRLATASAVSPNRKKLSAPDMLADLDVGAVERADGERAVERELHVAGARGLHAGGRDLLRQVGRRDHELGQA